MRQYASGIGKTANATYKLLSMIPFVFVLLLIALFLYINGPSLFPYWNQNHSNMIMIYVVMMMVFYVWAKKQTLTELRLPVNHVMFSFTTFFLLTWLIMYALIQGGVVVVASDFNMDLFWQTVLLQICVVATAEEMMFRGVLQAHVGIFFQAIAFAVWHSYAYNIIWYNGVFNWGALLWAFTMGIILGYVAKNKEWGLGGSIAIHSCVNLMLLGVLMI